MNSQFNLVDERWIPVVLASGEPAEVSLRELFADPAAIRDLHDDSPLVTVSLLRLLLTIVMASQPWRVAGAPKRKKLWREWWPNKTLPLTQINAYLDEWHGRFDLFDAQHPWMQTAALEMKERSGIERLAFEELLSGAFSFPENSVWNAPTPALAARVMLATQNFALGFGKSSVATVAGNTVEPPYSADAPLLRGLTIWHGGDTLCETLLLNLVPCEPNTDDQPSWELDAPHELRDILKNGKREAQAVRGPMDIFTFHARLLRLLPSIKDGQVVVREVYFTQGRSLEKVPGQAPFFDPMKLYFPSKDGFAPLALSENKAAWRDCHALLEAARKEEGQTHGLEAARWLAQNREVPDEFRHRLSVVGLATEPGKAGKFLLWRHDRFNLPMVLLRDANRIEKVNVALENAEELARTLGSRFRAVVKVFLAPNSDQPGGMQADKKNVDKLADAFDPRRAFWPRLEARFERFLRELAASNDLRAPVESWLDDIEGEARRCFRESRAQLGDQFRSYRGAVISDFFQTPARFQQTPKNSSAPAPASQGTLALEFSTGGDV